MIRDERINPGNILVITFTNASADDMRDRFFQMIHQEGGELPGSTYGNITFSTINGLCLRICASYARIYNRQIPELISEQDRRSLIASLYRRFSNDYPSDSDIRDISQKITFIKNMGIPDKDLDKTGSLDDKEAEIYREYCRALKSRRLMDYDDQIVFADQIMRDPRFAAVADRYRNRFRWILVDEAQDTSKLQHQIIRNLAGGNPNLFMAGDEDQSIYGFRAAWPDALLQFGETYENASIFRLQTNYRSRKEIVDAASSLICHNQKRYEKNMVADRSEGGVCKAVTVRKREDQYDQILDILRKSSETTAVLYRDNASGLPLILRLEKAGIPYQLRGQDAGFFTNKIVREVRDILTFALNPVNPHILERIYYKFGVKISRKALHMAMEEPRWAGDDPYLDALADSPALGKTGKEDLKVLQDQFRIIRQKNDASFALRCLRNAMSYRNASNEKLYILQALAEEGETIPEFFGKLRRMADVMERGCNTESSDNVSVVLSTIHGSKGLEYPEVIIIDGVQGILPGKDSDEEEERRIFYVGITRARDRLVMMRYGDRETPFVDQALGIKKAGPVRISGAVRKEAETYRPGTLVNHKSFGTGRIVSIDKDGKADIDFGGLGKKKMSLQACLSLGILKKQC